MKCRSFYYIVTNFEENQVFSCGATFVEFIESISQKPENILLLDSRCGSAKYHSDLWLDYIDSENMQDLLTDNVYSYGNFVWADYTDISC